jgi:hypothetical protein
MVRSEHIVSVTFSYILFIPGANHRACVNVNAMTLVHAISQARRRGESTTQARSC